MPPKTFPDLIVTNSGGKCQGFLSGSQFGNYIGQWKYNSQVLGRLAMSLVLGKLAMSLCSLKTADIWDLKTVIPKGNVSVEREWEQVDINQSY